jgi:hypothetical protein
VTRSSESLLAGEIREGDSVIVDADGASLTFRSGERTAAEPSAPDGS